MLFLQDTEEQLRILDRDEASRKVGTGHYQTVWQLALSATSLEVQGSSNDSIALAAESAAHSCRTRRNSFVFVLLSKV